jgi:hypothetical protein
LVDEEIKKEINNIKNNIELPADDSDKNLQEEQEDKWGRFLNNNTFLTIKNNFLSVKNIFSKFVTYIDNYFSKNDENIKNLKNDVNDIKTNGAGIKEKDIVDLANKKKENTFEELNTFEKGINSKLIKLDNNSLGVVDNDTIVVGDITKSINIIGKDNILRYNGQEIKGGNSSNNNGSSSSDDNSVFIAEYPLKQTIRTNEKGNKYLYSESIFNNSVMEYKTDVYNIIWSFNIEVNNNTKPILDYNSNPLKNLTGENVVGNMYNNNLNSNFIYFKSDRFNNMMLEALNVEKGKTLINIKNICGLKFKFRLYVDHIRDTSTSIDRGSRNYYIEKELSDGNEKDYEAFYSSESGNFDLNSISSYLNNDIVFDTSSNIKEFRIMYDTTNKLFYFHIEFKDNTFQNLYNSNKRLCINLKMRQIRLLKLTTQSSGGGSNGGYTDISSSYGLPIIAETINNSISIPNIRINKSEVTNAIKIDSVDYIKVFNGEIPINSYYGKINDDGNYYKRDVPLYTFITWSGDSYGHNFFIPNTYVGSVNEELYSRIFNDDTQNIPFPKIYGFKLKINIKVEKVYGEERKVLLDIYDDINIRFDKDGANNYNELIKKRDINKCIDNLSYREGDFINIVTIEEARLYVKYNKSGAYNKSKVYDYESKTFKEENVYTFFYIENASKLFSDNFDIIDISISTISGRILVKL